jgi:hypothetical protein
MASKEKNQINRAAEVEAPENNNGQQLSKNVLRQRAQRLQEIEDLIHAAETRLARIGQELQKASEKQDVAEIRRISQAYADTEAELADLLEDWELAHDV